MPVSSRASRTECQSLGTCRFTGSRGSRGSECESTVDADSGTCAAAAAADRNGGAATTSSEFACATGSPTSLTGANSSLEQGTSFEVPTQGVGASCSPPGMSNPVEDTICLCPDSGEASL